jgi:MFS_1 like family
MIEVEEDPLRFKMLYFFLYGGFGVLAPYIPVFFERLHMSKSQIGVLLMIPSMSSFIFAPLWSLFCDRLNLRTEVMFFALVASQVLTCSMYLIETFTSMISIVVVGSMAKAPLTSLLDSLVMDSLVDKTRYGSLRLWGAISFAITSFLGGAIISSLEAAGSLGVHPFFSVFCLHGVFGVLTGIIILSITVRSRRAKAVSIPTTDKLQTEEESATISDDTIANDECPMSFEEADAVKLSVTASVINVLTSCPSVGMFFVVVFCTGLGSGVIDAFLFLRLKQLGGSGLVMGVSRAITCAAEVPCFQIAGTLQKRLGTWRLLALTQLAFVIRFLYYSVLTEPWAVLPCEVLHGFTYAIMWSTACTYADEIAPKHVHSTIQVTAPYSMMQHDRMHVYY